CATDSYGSGIDFW
nr:immunoglobulin heavy chain junction region [Macaca mulatta]MOX06064.1 immunoglobulin heavy chain junction region [Macaca mulatta]